MLYWVTRTIGPSMFAYHAEARSPSLTADERVECPVGVAVFPYDLAASTAQLRRAHLNVQHWTEMRAAVTSARSRSPRCSPAMSSSSFAR